MRLVTSLDDPVTSVTLMPKAVPNALYQSPSCGPPSGPAVMTTSPSAFASLTSLLQSAWNLAVAGSREALAGTVADAGAATGVALVQAELTSRTARIATSLFDRMTPTLPRHARSDATAGMNVARLGRSWNVRARPTLRPP